MNHVNSSRPLACFQIVKGSLMTKHYAAITICALLLAPLLWLTLQIKEDRLGKVALYSYQAVSQLNSMVPMQDPGVMVSQN